MKCRSLLAMVIAVAFHLPTPAFSGLLIDKAKWFKISK
jgi:hypothetical protein